MSELSPATRSDTSDFSNVGRSRWWRRGFFASQTAYVAAALIVIMVVMSFLSSAFLSPGNLANVAKNFSFVGIVTLGVTLVIVTAVLRDHEVTVDTMIGGVCAYFLLSITWGNAYSLVELLLGDLADVAEEVRGERAVLVPAELRVRDLDARELGLMLVEVVRLRVVDARLHDHRRERVVPLRADRPTELLLRHLEERREPLHDPVALALRHVGGPELDDGAGHVRDERRAVAVEEQVLEAEAGDGL